MPDAHDFLANLALVLSTAAVAALLFQRLRQPVVLGYILAGVIIGPYVPIPLVADRGMVTALSELGVILLMFFIGLEFSLRKLARIGAPATLIGLLQVSVLFWLGYLAAEALGWTRMEGVYLGAALAISSTTIIAKAFEEQNVGGRLRDLVYGVLIVEDLIAILLLAFLTTVSSGQGVSAMAIGATAGGLMAFLVGLLVVGLLTVPRLMRAVVGQNRPEITLITAVGLCFGVSLLAYEFGYSVALGAFLAGALVAESGEGLRVETLVRPVRDVFAAIFFVAVGMSIDPAAIAAHWPAILALTAVVVLGKVFGVALGGLLTGNGVRTSVQAGMSMGQIGEFSFIIVGLGLSLGAIGQFLYPVVVSVSALTTLLTPFLIRASGPSANWLDRKLPKPVQTLNALYGSWLERLGRAPAGDTAALKLRRKLGLLVVDWLVVTAVIIGAAAGVNDIAAVLEDQLGVTPEVSYWLVIAAAATICVPFALGIWYYVRLIGVSLAALALPAAPADQADFAAAPRRALMVTLQLASLVAVGLPMIAVTQPFVPAAFTAAIFAVLLAVAGIAFWRGATNLQGHVRAGAELLLDAVGHPAGPPGGAAADPLQFGNLQELIPGLGEPRSVRLGAGHPAVGQSLGSLNVRGLTGATVLAIHRDHASVVVPVGEEILRADDLLVLAGTHEAVETAERFFSRPA